MGAERRVSDDQIRRALKDYCGNVTGAAQSLNISAKTLRSRIQDAGIDLNDYRRSHLVPKKLAVPITGTGTYEGYRYLSQVPVPKKLPVPMKGTGHKSPTGTYPKATTTPSLSDMEVPADAPQIERLAAPRPKPVRLRPIAQEMIRRGAILLSAHLGVVVDPDRLALEFTQQCFDAYVQGEIAAATAGEKKKAEEP